MSVRGYELLADWSRHGTFANALEDLTSYIDDQDVLVSYGRDGTRATTTATSGKLSFALNNVGRQFSPENTSSPIAGMVVPGTIVKLLKTHQGSTRTLYAGSLNQFSVDPQAPAKTFEAAVLDRHHHGGAALSTALYPGLRTGDAINLILDVLGWPQEQRDIDPGATLMPWWWEEGTDLAVAIEKIVQSEGPPAMAYVQGGTFVFRDRHHRILRDASQTSQATFTHAEPAGSGPVGSFMITSRSFSYDHGLAHIANVVMFAIDQREPTDIEEVWSVDTPLSLVSGETVTIRAESQDPFFNAITPVAGVDYEADPPITVELSRTSGKAVTLTVTASGGAVTIPRLALRATPIPVARTVQINAEDTASIGLHGRQKWPDALPWASVHDARAIAQRILSTYATNRPTVTFQIDALTDDYLTQILDRRPSDRVTVQNDAMDIDQEFIIERVTHYIRKLGVRHRLEMDCQVVDPVQPTNVFTFDVAGKGFNDGAFGVDGIDNPDNLFTFDVAGHGFDQGVFGS